MSILLSYIRKTLAYVPWSHWAVVGLLSLGLTLYILKRKKSSVYSTIALGAAALVGLLLLDVAVAIRYCGMMRHTSGYDLTLCFSRLLQKNGRGPAEIISNFIVFVPFGFLLYEFLLSSRGYHSQHWLGIATLVSFCLSLCIECLQLILRVGFFELTDLVMNTVGGFAGALVALLCWNLWTWRKGINS